MDQAKQNLHLPETELLRRLRAPESIQEAFALLVKMHQEQLYWHVRRMVGCHDDADEVLQTTFIKAWRNIESFRGDSKIRTWLFRIATNEALTYLERQKRHFHSPVEDHANSHQFSHRGALLPDADELLKRLEHAVEGLPDKQRQVFVMKYYDELTYEEMAEVLGGTVGSLKASFHHAVKKIEQFLTGD